MLGKINLHNYSGGVIKGNLEEYKARGNISAGDFVEMIKQKNTENGVIGEDTSLSTAQTGYRIDSVLLNENRIIVASTNLNSKMTISLCSIGNTKITPLTSVEIPSVIRDIKPSLLQIANDRILVFYASLYGSYTQFKCILCTIIDNTITVGTETILDSGYSGYIKSFKILDNEIILFYTTTNNTVIAARTATINENMSISLNTKILIDNARLLNNQQADILQITNNKFMLAFKYNNDLEALICKVDNSSIIFGTKTIINSNKLGDAISMTKISDTEVLISSALTSTGVTYAPLVNNLCEIDDTVISVKIYKQANVNVGKCDNNGYFTSTVMLMKDSGIIFYNASSGNKLYYLSFSITENDIEYGTSVELSTIENSGLSVQGLLIDESKILILHTILVNSSTINYNLFGMVYDSKIEKLVQKLKGPESVILGVAKKKGTDGQIVPVTVPDFNNKEE